jgi:hypothetical protein
MAMQMNEGFHVLGEIDDGGVALPEETEREVRNSFFDNSAYLSVKARLSFSF